MQKIVYIVINKMICDFKLQICRRRQDIKQKKPKHRRGKIEEEREKSRECSSYRQKPANEI